MYIVEVIPLTILPPNTPQLLSYFFNERLERGAVVEIPLGKRRITAVVTLSTLLENQKIILRKTGFQLKKIIRVISYSPQVTNFQFKIALWISRTYYAPLGYSLKTVLPVFFLKKGYATDYTVQKQIQTEATSKTKPLLITTSPGKTIENILPFIKKTLSIKTDPIPQIAIIVPDQTTFNYFYNGLNKNYHIAQISHNTSKKELHKIFKDINSGQIQIILGTRQALFAPFKNLGLIILDDPLHEFYKSDMTPKYNTPELAKAIAGFNNAKIIFTSTIIGVDNQWKIQEGQMEILNKKPTQRNISVANMTEERKNNNFSVFSQELQTKLAKILSSPEKSKRILIFSPRRGYSGVLVCQNCNLAVKCKGCSIAFRVHKTTEKILSCHHCLRTIAFPKNCPNCSGFNLKTVGPAGTQKIYDETLRFIENNNLSKIPILVLDTDVIKNETEETELINEIKKSQTSILISTQMIFSHRYDFSFDFIAVLNTDSLISVPEFKTEERLVYQIEKLIDFATNSNSKNIKNILLQTYNPENKTLLEIMSGNYKDFYENELRTRKLFWYPPFSQIIRISFKHRNREKALYESRVLLGKLKMAVTQMKLTETVKILDPYPSLAEKEKGFFVFNILIKILIGHEIMKDVLRFVPTNWSIDVNPRSII